MSRLQKTDGYIPWNFGLYFRPHGLWWNIIDTSYSISYFCCVPK